MRAAELLLHPVRLRIVQAMLGGKELTPGQLQESLSEVSAATVYRQIATLTEAGLLQVVRQRPIRGAVERTYRLVDPAAQLSPDDLADFGPDEHRAAFAAFIGGVMAGFDRYIDSADAHGGVDPLRDLVGYRQVAFWLTDAEMMTVTQAVNSVLVPLLANHHGDGRTLRILTTVLFPDDEPANDALADEQDGSDD
ncbi:MAG: helix-turn-helix domain-containing protein [Nakamurella sp.]